MSTNIKARVETITPDKAKAYLDKNVKNRTQKKGLLGTLVRSIQNGEWDVNGETIKFDVDGNLIDGQHRLEAIIEADTPVQSLVVYGLEPKVQETVDTGRMRSLADTLKMRGETNTNNLSATINMLYRWQRRNIYNRPENNPTRGQALRMLDEFPELRDLVAEGSSVAGKLGQGVPISVIASSSFMFKRLSEEDNADFWSCLANGYHATPNEDGTLRPMEVESPVLVLKNYIIRNQMGRHRQRPEVLLAVVVKAWNAYREGRVIKQLSWKSGGASPEAFPEAV